MEKKPVTRKTFLYYTGLFAVMLVVIFGGFVVLGKSFIWEVDGYAQHYLIFREYLGILRNFLSDPAAGFPFWDWNIGLGADVLSSYGYYAVGDPFVYLGLLFPAQWTELAYHLLVLLRLYVMGLAFLVFCRQMRIAEPGALLGSMTYTFSFYALLNTVRHPFFLLPMILFPLLCMGMENILQDKTDRLFTVSVFLAAFMNFYFFYMLTVLVFVFALIRCFGLYGFKDLQRAGNYFGKALGSYLIGLLMAGMLFLPVVWGFLHGARQPGAFAGGLWLYPLDYYRGLIQNLVNTRRSLWTVMGFSALTVLLLPLLFRWRRRFGHIALNLLVYFVFLLLPAFGSALNGFSGPYNRWTFALPLFVSAASAIFCNHLSLLTARDVKRMGLAAGLYSPVLLFLWYRTDFSRFYLLLLLLLWAMWAVCWRCSLAAGGKKLYPAVLAGMVLINLAVLAGHFYYPPGQNTAAALLDYGTVDQRYADSFHQAEELIADDGVYRIDTTSKDNIKNEMIVLDQMGVNSYLSVTNGAIADFALALDNSQFQPNQPLRKGFDDRGILNNFLGVKYILTQAGRSKYLPAGYEIIGRTGETAEDFVVAKTGQAYPLAYAESVYLPEEAFEQLDPVEKENFLSYGIVLPDTVPAEGLTLFQGDLKVEELDFSLSSTNPSGLTVSGDRITVKDPEAKLVLTLEDPAQLVRSQLYVHLDGIRFQPEPGTALNRTSGKYSVRAAFNGRSKSVLQQDRLSFHSYFPREDMLFYMGEQTGQPTENRLTLQFSAPGSYRIEDISLLILPFDDAYAERVAEKQAHALQIKTFGPTTISGSAALDGPGILTTTIPYTTGWKAEVNGEPVETMKVNYGFIGISLPAGEAEVTLHYETPLLRTGWACSLAGILLFLLNEKRQKRQKPFPAPAGK